MLLLHIAALVSVFTIASCSTGSGNQVHLSFNGCIKGKTASIVLPSTDPKSLQEAIDSIGQQFPVTFFATDAHFAEPQTLHALQAVQQGNLHTIGYQFNPAISSNTALVQASQVDAALAQAKQSFKQYLKQSLMYVLIPSGADSKFVEAVINNKVYPVIPNADGDQINKAGDKAQLSANQGGVVLAINPSEAINTPDYANVLHSSGFQIIPLTHCLQVNYNDNRVLLDTDDDDLAAKKGHSVSGEQLPSGSSESKETPTTVEPEEPSKIPWGMIAIGALVIGGIVLAVYFYRNQAN